MSVFFTSHHIDADTRVLAIFLKLSNTLLCQLLPPSCYIHCITEQPVVDIASNMTISKLESFLSQFPKQRGAPVKWNFYTHAAAASQPKPLRIITASSPVISKMVDTSYVGSSPVSIIMSTNLSKRSNSSTRD